VRAHATALFGSARAVQVALAGNVDFSGVGALLGGEGGVLRRLAHALRASRLLYAHATGGGALLVGGEAASAGGVAAEAAAAGAAAAGASPTAVLAGVGAAAAGAAAPLTPLPETARALIQRAAVNPEEESSAVALLLPLTADGEGAPAAAAAATLLGALLREPAFDELRTKQALGYVVTAGTRWVRGAREGARDAPQPPCDGARARVPAHCAPVRALVAPREGAAAPGEAPAPALAPVTSDASAHLCVVVMGTAVGAAVADARAAEFLSGAALHGVEALGEEALAETAGALAAAAEEPPRDGAAAFASVWAEVSGHTWRFARGAEEAAALRAVGKAQLLEMLRGAVAGARLAVEVVGRRERPAVEEGVEPPPFPLPEGAAEAALVQPRSRDE